MSLSLRGTRSRRIPAEYLTRLEGRGPDSPETGLVAHNVLYVGLSGPAAKLCRGINSIAFVLMMDRLGAW